MKGLDRKIPRTILKNKSQYIGAIVLIALSCMTFSVFNITGSNLLSNLSEFKSSHVQEDANFILASDLSDISALETKYDALIEKRGSADATYKTTSTLRILSATTKVDKYAVVQGKRLTGDSDILIDPAFANAHAIAIGSNIQVFGKSFKVSGYVSTPDYIYPLKNESDMMKTPNVFGIAVVSKSAFENLQKGYWFYSVKFNRPDQDALKNALAKDNTIIRWVDKENNMRISFINGDMEGIQPIGTALPLAILLVTCLLVSVVLGRLLQSEYTQIGVLYAIGYRKREIVRHYLTYPILMAILGGSIGTVAGALMVKPLLSYISSFYNLPILRIEYLPFMLILSFALPFLFLLPATLIVILRALRMSPLQLIHGGIKTSEPNFLEKSLRLRHLHFETKFKIREIVRNIPRTLLLFLGVTCASALLLLGFATKDSLDSLLGTGLLSTYRYQYVYDFNSVQTQQPASGEKVTLSPFTIVSHGEKITTIIYGIQPDARLIDLHDANGKRLDYNTIIVTQALASRLHIRSGDIITVQDQISLKRYTLKVGEVADLYVGDFIYMPLDRLNSMLKNPKGSYLELDSQQKLTIPSSQLISSTNRQYLLDSIQNILQPIQEMSEMIGAAAFIIGLIILYVVTSLLIEENRISISLLKILGYHKRQLYALLLNPYTIFVVLGYALSIPLVLSSLNALFNMVTAQMNIDIPAKLSILDIAWGFAIILVTYEFSKLLNRRKIATISMSAELKNPLE